MRVLPLHSDKEEKGKEGSVGLQKRVLVPGDQCQVAEVTI